jgi:hypothetical protein
VANLASGDPSVSSCTRRALIWDAWVMRPPSRREVQARALGQEHRHLTPRQRGVRAIVTATAAAGDAGGDECLDVLVLRMADQDVAESRDGWGGTHFETMKHTERGKGRAPRPDRPTKSSAQSRCSPQADPGEGQSRIRHSPASRESQCSLRLPARVLCPWAYGLDRTREIPVPPGVRSHASSSKRRI